MHLDAVRAIRSRNGMLPLFVLTLGLASPPGRGYNAVSVAAGLRHATVRPHRAVR